LISLIDSDLQHHFGIIASPYEYLFWKNLFTEEESLNILPVRSKSAFNDCVDVINHLCFSEFYPWKKFRCILFTMCDISYFVRMLFSLSDLSDVV